MTSKLSFRARALDSSKPMPVYRSEEVPDLPEYSAINRAVPQMPTGMEKEEECEHHLQRAISAQQAFGHTVEHVIPTPEVFTASEKDYDELYPPNYKISRQLIHMQLLTIEQDIPEYDMDSEDEQWLSMQPQDTGLTSLKFEEMMERLEKSSGQNVVSLKEAKLLLQEDDDVITAVFDYWLNKRLHTQQPLIPIVKSEKRDGSTGNNPYVAFRRRTEKMQTRKNRKNDETSYEKMLKLRRDLSRAVNLLELVKHRESLKSKHLKFSVDIFENRYKIGDFNGAIISEVTQLRNIRPAPYLSFNLQNKIVGRPKIPRNEEQPRRKREYKRRRPETAAVRHEVERNDFSFTSDEETGSVSPIADQPSDQEEQEDPDGQYAFRRKRGCSYVAPIIDKFGDWPWSSASDCGTGDRRYRFCLTSLSKPTPRCIGFTRRRFGRGGRLHFDRAFTPFDPFWSELTENKIPNGFPSKELLNEIQNDWLHFKPRSPQHESSNLYLSDNNDNNEYDSEGNVIPVVSITSVKEYIDDNSISSNILNGFQSESELETSFNRHQQELAEMQRKQLERLNNVNHQTGDVMTNTAKSVTTYNIYNSDHSSLSKLIASPQSSPLSKTYKGLTSDKTPNRTPQPILQPSTLDTASVQFAVSVVCSASDLTSNASSNVTYNRTQTHTTCANDSSKETQLNNCETKPFISDKHLLGTTNGPTIYDKDIYRKIHNNELSLPSTPSLSTSLVAAEIEANDSLSPLTPMTGSPNPMPSPQPNTCKKIFRSQKTNTTIPPTDVT
ncbi:enhancer of polycomb homolog 1-like [Oppia nitens]|uniref:enhancer of polycomb homolog 1-like n=1 Tax=Oppia nitens TaxID=1686743 RepID=UPI0023DAA0CC|nr:enhancer of polycomb homolog 1-like [Oppia nitens]